MKKLRKFLTIGVMVLSIIAMSGLTVNTAKAAAQAGDLIKMDGLSSVYYLGNDGKRYVFPSESVYFSWYADFSGVVTIPASELQTYPLGSNVTMRPGTKLVKITTDPSVYAVTPNGVLRKIQSEADAIALYGSNWNKIIVDVADSFFTNYTVGAPMPSGTYPAGTLLKNANNASIYYFDGTNYRMIASESAFNANRFNWSNVVTTTMTLTASGASITGAETFSAPSGGVGSPITGSGLSLSLSSQTPMSTSIPKNGVRVPFTKMNLTAASDGNVSVNSITVKRIGLSSYGDVDKVWAEVNGMIVASKKSMNSNDESILVFSPALVVPAGQTVTVDLLASLTGSGSGNIGLAVVSASAVSATAASVTGSFPINGNLMSLIAYNVAKLSVDGTVTTSSNVKVGDEKADLGRFNIGFNTSDSTAAKDVTISSVMLKNNGVEDLSKASMNLYLEYAGNKVSSSYTVDGRFVTFNFISGFDLLKDDGSKLIYLKGDVISKENSGDNSFVFELNKSTDLVAYEKSTGFGVNTYTNSSGTTLANALEISTRKIEAGAVSISKKSTSPSATTIIKGTDHVVLLANIRADEQVNADGMRLTYGSTASTFASTTNQFENVRVFLNGVLLDSFDPSFSTTTDLSTVIDSSLTLNKGDNEVRVMVKAKSNATPASAFYAKLGNDAFTGMNAEYVISGNSVTSISGNATGAEFTVQGAGLETVRNDGYGLNKSIVQGSTDVSLGKFVLKATNDVVTVTSISLGQNIGAATSTLASSINDMKLFVDGVQVGNTVNFGTSGSTFTSLNINIAKDSTKAVEILGSFDSAAADDSYFKTLMTVNAQDSRGTVIVSGHTAETTQFQITANATLRVEVGGDTPVDGILASKNVEQEVGQFKFTAIDDSANLTEINVINWDGTAATSSADARIAAIKLYDGANLVDQFVPVNGAGKFTIANNTVVVPANGSKTLSVRVVLNNIENDATATNKDIQVRLTSTKFKSTAGVEATSANTNVTANTFRIRKTVPTITAQVLPDTLLNAGEKVIAKFTVTADSNADVTVGRFTLLTSKTASATLATSTNGLKINGSNKAATQTLSGTGDSLMTVLLGTPEIVAAGTTKTFEVIATVGVSGTGSESITAKIVEDAAYEADDTLGDITGAFAWSDGASIEAYTWANGHNVAGLDTPTWTLSKN